VVSQKPEDIDPLIEDGAVGDPASLGVGVILRNWTRTDTNNSIYSFYAGQQAGYLIHKAPRTKDDAVSHRNDQVQLWSDFVSMGPPFLAYFGATFGGPDGLWLMQYAFNQCRLYRQYLKDAQSGLWKHIVLGNWQDNAHWATGNAWAAAGMLRTLVAIQHSPGADQMKAEQRNLTTWIGEILGSTWPGQQLNGTLLNVLDAQPQNTFADSAATALLTAVTFRHALISNDTSYIDKAVLAMQLVKGSIDEFGWLRFTVDPYTFDKPLQRTGNEWGSPEGQAFVLMVSIIKLKVSQGKR
jgi:rhamnogalacturonyl hydrolase YesR